MKNSGLTITCRKCGIRVAWYYGETARSIAGGICDHCRQKEEKPDKQESHLSIRCVCGGRIEMPRTDKPMAYICLTCAAFYDMAIPPPPPQEVTLCCTKRGRGPMAPRTGTTIIILATDIVCERGEEDGHKQ